MFPHPLVFTYRPNLLRENSPTDAGRCFSPPPFRFAHAATLTALRQGEKHPLTVLVSVAFALQRNGSGGSRLAWGVCLIDTFFS